MGWQDRNYDQQINYGGNPYTHPLLKLIFGSVYIGRLFRIRIRIHASLLWYIGLSVAFSGGNWSNALMASGVLFAIVLLHEFGHCFAARSVGGDADEIMLWILGGLAFARSPHRPWPRFVTVAGGPLVNVAIAAILGTIIYFVYHVVPPYNPLIPFVSQFEMNWLRNQPGAWILYTKGWFIFWLYSVNLMILFFNLIPMYPLDGGQMFQAILWKPLGYVRSMKIACYTGMVFAFFMIPLAIATSFFVLFIAAFSFIACLQQLRILRMTAVEEQESEPYDLSAAWDNPDHPPKRRRAKVRKRWFKWARKQASREQAEQARIDAILAKVKEKGLHSLTWFEKRALRKATERQRQSDLAERL